MKPCKCTLPLLTLSVAVLLGTTAVASDLPKEGKFTAIYHGVGTYKSATMGKDAVISGWDEIGYTVGDGLFDHLTWHCFGIYDAAAGLAKFIGHCVTTDPAGDQIAADVASEGAAAVDAKMTRGKGVFTGGTGKYAGISGSWTLVTHSGEYKLSVDNTYVQLGSNEGSYKLH
jgi:hypothetical protein